MIELRPDLCRTPLITIRHLISNLFKEAEFFLTFTLEVESSVSGLDTTTVLSNTRERNIAKHDSGASLDLNSRALLAIL